ncbi:LysR family transcriptional regulator [Acinetobacter sp. NIPH 2699]|uniref:LysR family transcriptional regulator n=1 Tax=Acinetobacter sp. NIPH 2699 TaxID=2923433 RepID=UPI001F4B1310|nr:LysR family transcriptional regulator [Acinetobacter sp. NIPH 2699]MCH7335756.1 LysR family transcriptional regulator [Acinetobacter sp. NIPH 2699]
MERANLNDLKAVMAIARRGTFRGAAIELGMSTTALSHAIGKLEGNLGVRLFNRTTRSVSLTEAGRLFVEQVGPALQDIHSALDIVRSQRESPSGTLRINAAAFAAREIISPLIIEFLRRYPEMNIDLVTEGKLVDIIAAGFDLGIRVAHLVPSDMIAVSLGKAQRYVVVGSPKYFERYGKPKIPTDLFKHQCIRVRLPDGALFRWKFEKEGEIVQIDVQGPITLDEASLVRVAVLEHVGLGYFMEQDVGAEIESGQLISVLDDWMPCVSGLCLYYSGRRNQSAGLKAFLALAREMATDIRD